MACTSKEAWRMFHRLISKGDFIYHTSPRCWLHMPTSERSLTGGGYLNAVHRSLSGGGTWCIHSYLMRERWKSNPRRQETSEDTILSFSMDVCVVCRDRVALIIHSPVKSKPGLEVGSSPPQSAKPWEGKEIETNPLCCALKSMVRYLNETVHIWQA